MLVVRRQFYRSNFHSGGNLCCSGIGVGIDINMFFKSVSFSDNDVFQSYQLVIQILLLLHLLMSIPIEMLSTSHDVYVLMTSSFALI